MNLPTAIPAAQASPAAKTTSALLDAALDYRKRGLSVLPLNGKRPTIESWSAFQKKAATENQIRQWHKNGLLQNLGIICGAVSNNLVVLDFDGLGAYSAFAALYPSIASTYTVATGSGQGKHVYLYVDELPPTTKALDTPIGNLELRAEGCYVAAPPSIHPITKKSYLVEKAGEIQHVPDLKEVVSWIEAFKTPPPSWKPPRDLPAMEGTINPALIEAVAETLRNRGRHRERGDWLNCSCIHPERHKNGDRNPSMGFNLRTGYAYCWKCGSMLAKEVCEALDIDPAAHGGLMKPQEIVAIAPPSGGGVPALPPPPTPPQDPIKPLAELVLPDWLSRYVSWASGVGNQTPVTFHQGAGIWLLAVAIARRLYVEAPWGVKIFPNFYMMFVADTTFYRKTTAYKLAESVIRGSIPHMLMPTPGSPERFQESLAGRMPGNYKELSYAQQEVLSKGRAFAAQRGLFKDEVAGLFGAFNRKDYMYGLKDLIMELYDCPDYSDKDTQTGLTIVENAALSILGVTTPAGMAGAISDADWQNGLLPRFLLLTPEPEYAERPSLRGSGKPPEDIVNGLKQLYERLPMPEAEGDGWSAPEALKVEAQCWPSVEAYSNRLRKLCDPNEETALDDRLKGVYGRMHVQAIKVAMILAALDWMKSDAPAPVVTAENWKTAETIAEHWRSSAHRLLENLDRSGSARQEFRAQDRLLEIFRQAGPSGATLRTVYRRLNLKAKDARQIAQDLVKAGLLVEITIEGAEGYAMPFRTNRD